MTARIKAFLFVAALFGATSAFAFDQTGAPGAGGGGAPTGAAGGELTGTYPNPSIAAEAVDLDNLDMPSDYSAYTELLPAYNTTSKQARPLGIITTYYFEQSRETPRFVLSATNNAFIVDAATNPAYGMMAFSHSASSTANCGYFPMPAVRDYNTGVDLRLDEFRVINGSATDSGGQVYDVAVATKVLTKTWLSATYVSTQAVTMASSLGTASGEERAYATADTLVGWKDVVASGIPWCIRVCREGDAAGDTSTIDSRFSMFTIRAGDTIP